MKHHKAGDEQGYLFLFWKDCASEMPCTRYLQNITEEQHIRVWKKSDGKSFILQQNKSVFPCFQEFKCININTIYSLVQKQNLAQQQSQCFQEDEEHRTHLVLCSVPLQLQLPFLANTLKGTQTLLLQLCSKSLLQGGSMHTPWPKISGETQYADVFIVLQLLFYGKVKRWGEWTENIRNQPLHTEKKLIVFHFFQPDKRYMTHP